MTIILRRMTMMALGLSLGVAAQAAELLHYQDSGWDPRIRVLVHSPTKWMPAGWKDTVQVPAPPGLAETRREVDFLMELKVERPARANNIAVEDDYIGTRYLELLGIKASAQPKTVALIDDLVDEALRVVLHFKARFVRARPWQYDERLEPIIDPPGHPAYPSGHSTQANTLSMVLSELYPQRRDELNRLGHEIARNREVGGVHYPSDSAAGRILAEQIVERLFQVEDFRTVFAAARAEL